MVRAVVGGDGAGEFARDDAFARPTVDKDEVAVGMTGKNVAQRVFVDAAVADDGNAVVGDRCAVVAGEDVAQDDADRCASAGKRDQRRRRAVFGGNQRGKAQTVGSEAGIVLRAGVMKEREVGSARRVFGREHFAVVLLPALDERFFGGGIGNRREFDGF